PSTTISWQSAIDGNVSIKIYDILGNEVAEILNEFKFSGLYDIKFEIASINNYLPSGVYIYKIEIKNNELLYTMNNKMTLLK
ncbi:MAG: T9SS type A sorting domain-containing protein, partial [Ignavibacteria bacterium]|nr:T9SS type A sorting domain-containing protein [Ignavibacteria bacterium]